MGHTTEEAARAVEAGKGSLALHYSLLTTHYSLLTTYSKQAIITLGLPALHN